MNKYKKCIKWKDIIIRAIKTFIQSFLAVLSIEGIITLQNFNALKTAAISASVATVSALVSAFMNVINCFVNRYKEDKEKEYIAHTDNK